MSAAQKNVLLVEDEALFADTLAVTLRRAGYGAAVAHGAQEAVDMLDNSTPDLIILDIFLPEGNGVQLLHELRTHRDTAKTPVIICSSAHGQLPEKVLKSYGVKAVLDKAALTSTVLREHVESALRP